ncbi:MAG: hypothetical protein M3N31_02970, partial [Actinomycetota bacterium]|nr:hypothetical protein [Actinomycetota bacterium]
MHRRTLGLFLAALVLLTGAQRAAAAPRREAEQSDQVTARIESLRDQVSQASAEEAAVLDQLDQAEARRGQIDGRVAELDRQLAGVEGEARAAEARLEVVQAGFVRTQMDLGRARDGLAEARQEVRAQAVSAYLGNPSASTADTLLRSGNLRELATTSSYLESVAEARKRVVERYRQMRDATEDLQGSVEARKDEAKAQRDVVIARRSALEAVRSELDATRRQAMGEEAHKQALVNGLRARVSDFELQISVLRSDSDSLAGLLQS